ncbi:hypothetical protein AAVH_00071 [Aphelenchoides avenae]|nr:hypothetical protein AAVH_00071 [Aphelenchus avenae]
MQPQMVPQEATQHQTSTTSDESYVIARYRYLLEGIVTDATATAPIRSVDLCRKLRELEPAAFDYFDRKMWNVRDFIIEHCAKWIKITRNPGVDWWASWKNECDNETRCDNYEGSRFETQ